MFWVLNLFFISTSLISAKLLLHSSSPSCNRQHRAMMIVWRLGGIMNRTFLSCIVYDICAKWYAHTCEYFLNLHVDLGLHFVFVCLFRFSIFRVFVCVVIDYFIPVLLAFVVLGLVSSVTKPRNWLGRTFPKWPILCWVGCRTLTELT